MDPKSFNMSSMLISRPWLDSFCLVSIFATDKTNFFCKEAEFIVLLEQKPDM